MIEGFGTNDIVLQFAIYGGVTVFGLVRAARYPTSSHVADWMLAHGLDPDARTRESIAHYLNRTRWIRTIGFLVGFNIPFAWMWVTRSAYRMSEGFDFWWLAGFAVGILLAEVLRTHPAGSAAVIEPRRLDHYLPGFTSWDRWILAALAVLPVIASVVLPYAEPGFPNGGGPVRHGFGWYLSLSLWALGIIVATRLVQEWIVGRRQSFEDVEDLRADDAMRSASIQGLAGLSYGAPMWITATMGQDLVLTANPPGSWVFGALSLLLMAGGLAMLVGFPRLANRWTVPRAREA